MERTEIIKTQKASFFAWRAVSKRLGFNQLQFFKDLL